MADPTDLPFTRQNRIFFAASLVSIVLGYIFLRIPPADGFFSLTLAPVLLVLGYCALMPLAILYKGKNGEAQAPS
ncbi:MAG: hypothetical protein ACKVJG_13955 [Candidatus Latescibacterota bacterium]|jgi:ABC-type nitrate/sulfonate/bicarbonate transport system permease component|tara:strand:- start:1114 stop:1338 length:225 start_codon:yes stop_codon:yes gene_type:complete